MTLLRAVGVQAWPALVHSSFGRGVLDRLPSPGAFDHVIAKVRFDGRDYWLDATASGQGGRLGTLVQADFGPALVLAPGMDGLENMPQRTDSTPTSVVAETFDFRQGTDKSAQFSVHTVYRDEDADSMRVRMRSQTATRLGEDYLDYYRKSYGGIRILQPLRTADDRDANTFTIDERYVIDDPFEKDDDGERTFGLEAYLISDQTQEPDQAVRTSPLARDFPKHVHHEIVAYLPGEWNVENESSSVADSAFEYRFNARFKGGKLELTYDLHNTRDHVPPDALKTFLSKLKKARDDAFYTLTDGDKTAPAAVKPDSSVSTHAVLVTTLILGLVLGVVAVFGLARMPWSLPAAAANAPHGLGGWMALPTLGLIITPLQLLYVIWTWFRDLGGGTAFGLLSAPVQYLLLLELVCIALLLVVGLYTLWLLFTEDSRFPYSFIAVMSVSVLVMIFDVAALVAIGESVRKELESDVRSLFLRLLAAVLWISYMLTSERVRATFVNRSRDGADYRARRVPAVIGEAAQ